MSLPGISAILVVLIAGILLFGCGKEQKAPPQAPIVEVVEVTQKDVPVYGEWVGSLDGAVNATIRAQVQGYLIKQNYTEGDFVKKDQVLFEIDPRPFQAAIVGGERAVGPGGSTLADGKGKPGANQASG